MKWCTAPKIYAEFSKRKYTLLIASGLYSMIYVSLHTRRETFNSRISEQGLVRTSNSHTADPKVSAQISIVLLVESRFRNISRAHKPIKPIKRHRKTGPSCVSITVWRKIASCWLVLAVIARSSEGGGWVYVRVCGGGSVTADWHLKQVNSVCGGGIQGDSVLFITCSNDMRLHITHTHAHTHTALTGKWGNKCTITSHNKGANNMTTHNIIQYDITIVTFYINISSRPMTSLH